MNGALCQSHSIRRLVWTFVFLEETRAGEELEESLNTSRAAGVIALTVMDARRSLVLELRPRLVLPVASPAVGGVLLAVVTPTI